MESIERDGERLHWTSFGQETIAYFELLVIQNVATHDIYTGLGLDQKILTGKWIPEKQVFEGEVHTFTPFPMYPMDWDFLSGFL